MMFMFESQPAWLVRVAPASSVQHPQSSSEEGGGDGGGGDGGGGDGGGGDGDGGGGGDDGRISPEHPSPIIHAPRDIISRKGKSLTPICCSSACMLVSHTQNV